MYGLIGKIKANAGQRDALIEILLESAQKMPGCLSYIVGRDHADVDAIWITEVWVDKDSHQNSLSLPTVQNAIMQGKSLIAGFGERFEFEPIGGHGLVSA